VWNVVRYFISPKIILNGLKNIICSHLKDARNAEKRNTNVSNAVLCSGFLKIILNGLRKKVWIHLRDVRSAAINEKIKERAKKWMIKN
jgi:hypothetical protein